jgi:polyphosphate kinase 2 (PPK2 family)
MPAALTEFRGVLNTRTRLDLTTATQSRVIARVGAAPAANAKIKIQYSTDDSTWYDLCSVTMPATANLTNVGPWTNVPADAKADVFLRVVGIDGNGTADPTFGLITLGVK